MGRRVRSLRDLRAEHEAAEARGLINDKPAPARVPKADSERRPESSGRTRVVWAVCDMGNRPVATFPYNDKAGAEALVVALKARGKGEHFVRSHKEPMQPREDD